QRIHITHSMTRQKLVREFPRANEQKPNRGEKLRVPIQKRIQKIENDVPKRTAIIDGGLSALRAICSAQRSAAVFAMCERPRKPSGLSLFAATEETFPSWLFDRGNRGVAQNELGRFIAHSPRL